MLLERETLELLNYYKKRTEILEKQRLWMAKELADVYLSELCGSDDKQSIPEYWITRAEKAVCSS